MSEEDWAAAKAAHARGDYAIALRLYRRLADQGNARAQDNLGVFYEHGLGVARSYAEAVNWYRMAAEQGEPNAQNNLGVMYETGRGVPADPAEAVKWYQRAATQGDLNAQHNLGNMYESGHGVAQNYTEAVTWFRKAEVIRWRRRTSASCTSSATEFRVTSSRPTCGSRCPQHAFRLPRRRIAGSPRGIATRSRRG